VTSDPLVGQTLGRYRLREPLAAGGQGQVYLADDLDLGRTVVVKVRPAAVAAQRAAATAEATAAAAIDHPYAIHVYASGLTDDGLAWTAMEWVRGPTLAELVARRGPLPPGEAVELIARLAEVVAALHGSGVIHRDVTPANVLVVTRAGAALPKLGDFGLVGTADDDGAGTPAYLAPELWRGLTATPAVDVYALAGCAYLALTGAPPFVGGLGELAAAHAADARPTLPPEVPRAIAAAVTRGLAIDPAARPSALGLAAALRAGVGGDRRPGLDAELLAAALANAPEPIAEALAAWEATATLAAAAAAVDAAILAIARWIGVCALALVRADGDREAERRAVAGLGDEPTPASWLAIAAPSARPLGAAIERARVRLRDVLAAEPAAAELAERVAVSTATLAAAVRGLGPLLAWRVVARIDDRVVRWTGVRRRHRPTVWHGAPDELPAGAAALLDDDGAMAVALDELTAVAPPFAGAPPELFVLERLDGDGAILAAHPTGYVRRVARGSLGSAGVDPTGDAPSEHGPYPGLAAYRAADARWFVGRERELVACQNRLRDRPLMAVIGPSGAGKSSFVAAGVLPALAATTAVTLRPSAGFGAALARALGHPDAAPLAAVTAAAAAGTVAIVVDQLEEIVARGADATDLGALLAAAAAIPGVTILATVRDDFFVRAAAALGLAEQLGAGAFLLGPPGRADLERIVAEPAARAGYGFDDPTLPATMVDAAIAAAAPLPLLAFAARALWQRRDRRLRQLCRHDYDAVGGVAGALAGHADAIVDGLPPARRALVRPIFANLATAEGTRVPLTRRDLAELVPDPDRAAVVDALIDARLLASSDGDDGGRIELVHEALLTAWPRLAGWRKDDAAAAVVRDAVRTAAQQWDARGRSRDLVWRGDALIEARAWRRRHTPALTERERGFLDASDRDDQRRRRWRRGLALTAAVAAATAIAILARSNREVRRQRRLAVAAEAQARASGAEVAARLQAQLLEQGRTALLDERPLVALAWLAAAVEAGADPARFPRLAGEAAALLGARGARRSILTAAVNQLAWSRDGALVALGSRVPDGRVAIVGRDGAVRHWVASRGGPVSSVDFAADGARLASVAAGAVVVTEVATGREVAVVTSKARIARYSPDGRWLATADLDGGVRLWDAATLTLARRLAPVSVPAGTATVVDLDWLAGGPLVVGDRAGRLRVHEPTTGRLLAEHTGGPAVLDLVVVGDVVAVQPFAGREPAVWNWRTGVHHALVGHRKDVEEIAVDPTATWAATASLDGAAGWWRIADGRAHQVGGGGGALVDVGFAGDAAITGGADGQLRRWRGDDEQLIGAHAAGLVSLEVAPDGATVAAGDQDGHLGLWSTAPSLVLEPIAPAVSQVLTVDRARIEIGPGAARQDGATLPARPSHPAAPGSIVVDHLRTGGVLGGAVVIPDGDGALRLERDGAPGWRCATAAAALAARPAGADVLVATIAGQLVRCRPGAAPEVLASADGALRALAVSPAGRWALVASVDRRLVAVELGRGARVEATLARPATVAAWLDEQHALLGTASGDLVRLDVATGATAVVHAGDGHQATAIATVDAAHVALGFDDGAVDLIALPLGAPVRRWRLGGPPLSLALEGAGLRVTLRGATGVLPLAPPIATAEELQRQGCAADLHVADGALRPGRAPGCPPR